MCFQKKSWEHLFLISWHWSTFIVLIFYFLCEISYPIFFFICLCTKKNNSVLIVYYYHYLLFYYNFFSFRRQQWRWWRHKKRWTFSFGSHPKNEKKQKTKSPINMHSSQSNDARTFAWSQKICFVLLLGGLYIVYKYIFICVPQCVSVWIYKLLFVSGVWWFLVAHEKVNLSI